MSHWTLSYFIEMKKILLSIAILTGLAFGILGLLISFEDSTFPNPKEVTASLRYERLFMALKESKSKVVVFAVGDIMIDRGVEYMIKKEGDGDFKFPFLKIKKDLSRADILFGNLEGPVSDQGVKVGSVYSFRMDPKVIESLDYAGFDILSLANNHMLDYTRVALEDTLDRLEQQGIDYVGAGIGSEAFSLKIKEAGNTKVGFLAYTDLGSENWKSSKNKIGMAWISVEDIDKIKNDISIAKDKVDVLIVSLHSGHEYASEPTYFQKRFNKTCIEAGADIILGHHPHVVQRIEKYEEGWIAYSLGNFVFDQNFSKETMQGSLLEIVITNGRIKEVKERKVNISEFFQPAL